MQQKSTTSGAAKRRGLLGFISAFIRILLVVLLSIVVFLQLADLLTRIAPVFGYETQIVSCESVGVYSNQGWRVVAAYSYSLGGGYTGYTVYNDCVLERPKPLFTR